jgi:hypothetical protein
MMSPAPILLRMPACGEEGLIVAWKADEPGWVEFRGPPYSTWDADIRTISSPFYRMHATLEGWHASPLHMDDVVTILPGRHPDYDLVSELYDGNDSYVFFRTGRDVRVQGRRLSLVTTLLPVAWPSWRDAGRAYNGQVAFLDGRPVRVHWTEPLVTTDPVAGAPVALEIWTEDLR